MQEKAAVAVEYAYCFEVLRAVLREEIRRSGERETARQLHVRRSTLQRFLEGGDPGAKLCAAAAELAQDRPQPAVAPEAVALALLSDVFPPSRRAEMLQTYAQALRPIWNREGRTTP